MGIWRQSVENGESTVEPAVGIVRFFFLSLLLWFYVVFLIFVWYGARHTQESAVLVRLAASILSDLVWIPLGLAVWSRFVFLILKQVFRPEGFSSGIYFRITAVIAAVLFFIFRHETAFTFLAIPLTVYLFDMAVCLYCSGSRRRVISYYIPLSTVIILTVSYYGSQLFPSLAHGKRSDDIKVMGYNIFAHADYEDRMRVLETIKRESPDVVCIMEFNPMRDPELFRSELGEQYQYMLIGDDLTRWTRSSAYILSKFPIKKIPVEKISNKEDRHVNFIFAEMNVRGRVVNIVNYHLITVGHRIARAAQRNLTSRDHVRRAKDTEQTIDREKYDQVQYMIEKISTFKEPTILCGDLNDTPNSRVFHILNRRFENTFSERGWGLGSTFGESWLLRRFRNMGKLSLLARDVMRIDHIFVSNDIDVVSSRAVREAGGSDHKPVVSVLHVGGE